MLAQKLEESKIRCILSIILVFSMVLLQAPAGLFSIASSAATNDYYTYAVTDEETIPVREYVASGTCSDNLTWTLDVEGTLTISGTGSMPDYYAYAEALSFDFWGDSNDEVYSYYGDSPWFDYREYIKTVEIHDGITSIGDSAFSYCSNISCITIPHSITNIGDEAFYFCSSLAGITIPSSVTAIGKRAFMYCSQLKRILVDTGNAFYYSDDYGVLYNKVTKTLIKAPAKYDFGTYFIPDGVTSIGYGAFYDCGGLTGITIPDSVTIIDESAFNNCMNLTFITIPDSVTKIEDHAFENCYKLWYVSYTGTRSQECAISIDSSNSYLKKSVWHYETKFQIIDNCLETSVYCPACERYLISEQHKGSTHSYSDWVVTKPATFNEAGEQEKICSACGDRVTETIPMRTGGVAYWGISLADDIGATFYLNLDGYDLESTFVTVQVNDIKYKYNMPDLASVDGKYVVKVNVAAAQMCDDIVIQIFSGDEMIREMRYTIRQYAEHILNGDYSEETKDLVYAMLNYGASAQKFFNYNTTDLANDGCEITDVPKISETATDFSVIGTVDGITLYGASLNFDTKISVRFYFTVTGKIGDYTFTDANSNTYQARYKDGMYYVEVPNINPADYDKDIKIIVHNGSSVMLVDYSPLRYISRKFYGSNKPDLVNLVAALYRYHKAAKAYLNSI